MAGRSNARGFECLVVDLNTQRDFCHADGAAPVSNREPLATALRRMIAWVRRNHAPVVSSIESHRWCDLSDSGQPLCCLDGSPGQQKLDYTLLPQRVWIEADNTLWCPLDIFHHYQQAIFRKHTDDLLRNPKADRLFTQLRADEIIVFGVSAEGSVKALVLGLLARNKNVTVVSDACGYWSGATADLALRQVGAKGANLITVDELLMRRLTRRVRYAARLHAADGNGHAGGNGSPKRNGSHKTNPLTSRLPDEPRPTTMPRNRVRNARKRA